MGISFLVQAALLPLLTVASDGRPMRFGVPLPVEALDDGLSLRGRGALQWRPLPVAPMADGTAWVEVAIVAPRGNVRIVRGGRGPDDGQGGAAFVRTEQRRAVPHGEVVETRWEWCDGSCDERVQTRFAHRTVVDVDAFHAGESWTVESDGLCRRARIWWQRGRPWAVRAGLLPEPGAAGAVGRQVRRHLAAVVGALRELPGRRGAGDFARGDGTVTNLEFDTTFALLRCAVGLADERAFALARRCARHLCDRDLDHSSGLPFAHGLGHRSNRPQSGHVWLRGLLWVGLLTADDELIETALGIARALAATPPPGVGRSERLRDFAWPLAELEFAARFTPEPVLFTAADRLAQAVFARFDPIARTYRFGEGEGASANDDATYFERGWLTAGLLLPALRSHLRRRGDVDAERNLRIVEAALVDAFGSGGKGLPTHWRIADGRAFAVHCERGTPRSCFSLDGLPDRELRRLLRRSTMRRAVVHTPAIDDVDLPTSFTLVARSDWVWR